MSTPLPRALAIAAAALALAPAAASAESIVYLKDANVWLAGPDGSGAVQVTTDGTASAPYLSPSQADDGTIAAGKGEEIVLLRQNGEVIRTLDPPALSDSVSAPVDGVPVYVALSPNGSKVAYGFARYSCPIGADCTARTATGYMSTDPAVPAQSFGHVYLSNPSWVGESRTLVFGGYLHQVNVHDLGQPQDVHWFDDQDTDPDDSTDLGDGELNRQGDKLAVVRGYGSTAHVRWYHVAAPFPAVPAPLCDTSQAEGTAGPSWSPDGTALAVEQPDGIYVLRGITTDPAACSSVSATLTIPGASAPDWGPAAADPTPRSGGPGGPVATPGRVGLTLVGARTPRAVVKTGLRVRLTCPGACRVQASLVAGKAAARALGMRRPGAVVQRTGRLRAAGATTLALRPAPAIGKRLGTLRAVRLTLRVKVTHADGSVKTVSRQLRVAR
jgi:hypothetical protein